MTRIKRLRDWHETTVLPGVDCAKPGLYEWKIEGAGSYIGQYGRIQRPTKEYARNVARLIAGLIYRAGKVDGFRRIHHELAKAHRERRQIELIILENAEKPGINAREQAIIRERGNLNGPALSERFGWSSMSQIRPLNADGTLKSVEEVATMNQYHSSKQGDPNLS